MGLIHVFDHDDLKLAGQENNRQSGEQNQRSPGTGAPGFEFKESAKISFGNSPLEEVTQAAEQAVGHKNADRHEGNQLDHRFKGDGGHHAFVPLGCIKMAGAEQDGKQGEDDGDQEGRIQAQPLPLAAGVIEQDIHTGCHRFQLQGNVRHHANHRDHRHHTGQQLALAVTRGNEIGNRGNPLRLADADHLDDDTDEQQHQRRPEVNGQKGQAAGGRPADAAVERPGRAIHGQRQGIHIGRNDRLASIGTRVAKTGDSKQHGEIGGRQQGNEPTGEHHLKSPVVRPPKRQERSVRPIRRTGRDS